MATQVRQAVFDGGARFWRPEDFEANPLTVDRALSRLEGDRVLRRIRRGLYWRGVETALGMAPPDRSQLVEAVVGRRGVGPAGASAALQLGLTTQFPRQPEIAVPGRPPSGLAGVTFRNRASRTGRVSEDLTALEVAVLEVLEDWDEVVELPDRDAVTELVDVLRKRVDVARLARAAISERPLVRERLRMLLDRAGFAALSAAIPEARSERTRSLARNVGGLAA